MVNCITKILENSLLWFGLVLMLNVSVNNFSVMLGRSHRFLGITSTFGGKYVLLKDTTRRPEWGSNPENSLCKAIQNYTYNKSKHERKKFHNQNHKFCHSLHFKRLITSGKSRTLTNTESRVHGNDFFYFVTTYWSLGINNGES